MINKHYIFFFLLVSIASYGIPDDQTIPTIDESSPYFKITYRELLHRALITSSLTEKSKDSFRLFIEAYGKGPNTTSDLSSNDYYYNNDQFSQLCEQLKGVRLEIPETTELFEKEKANNISYTTQKNLSLQLGYAISVVQRHAYASRRTP